MRLSVREAKSIEFDETILLDILTIAHCDTNYYLDVSIFGTGETPPLRLYDALPFGTRRKT